jgi:hypothetical protein
MRTSKSEPSENDLAFLPLRKKPNVFQDFVIQNSITAIILNDLKSFC